MIKFLTCLAAACIAAPGAATPQIDALSRCVADNTSGKDRKDLARWLFTAMAVHPEIRSISSLAPTAAENASRTAAALFTRLLADTCPDEVRAAMRSGGPAAIQAAFQVLGQLAMQELMSDKDVAAAMALLERYLDRQKLETLNRP